MAARPSYRALRAFVETVDAGSAAAAGRRLGVSASAVSHLIRELERQLDCRLFVAGPQSELTMAGRRLEQGVGASFTSIARALDDFAGSGIELRVSTVATFAALWLTPRLKAFTDARPDVRVTISSARSVVRLGVEPFDCSIRWGRGDWPDATSQRLFDEVLVLVSSPGLLEERRPVGPLGLPRIAALTRPDDWPAFLSAAGGEPARPALMVEDRASAVACAAEGIGVAVVDRTLASRLLESGRLVEASVAECPLRDGFHLVSNPTGSSRDAVPAFREWLLGTIASERLS